MIRVVVGSRSPIKLEAVRKAVEALGLEAEIVGADCASGVPPQPYGREQTIEGAANRARQVTGVRGDVYAVGIENGLVPCGAGRVEDVAYVAVYAPSGRRFIRRSAGVPVPPPLVEAVLKGGQLVTAGALEAELSGCDPADPHVVWSGGKRRREEILALAAYAALLPATLSEGGASS